MMPTASPVIIVKMTCGRRARISRTASPDLSPPPAPPSTPLLNRRTFSLFDGSIAATPLMSSPGSPAMSSASPPPAWSPLCKIIAFCGKSPSSRPYCAQRSAMTGANKSANIFA